MNSSLWKELHKIFSTKCEAFRTFIKDAWSWVASWEGQVSGGGLFCINLIVQVNLFVTASYAMQVKAATTTVSNSKEMKRETISPDSIIKSLNFQSCWVSRHFINFAKLFLWHILNHSGLLVNSAYVTHWIRLSVPVMCTFIIWI